jgi:hypothetical protein
MAVHSRQFERFAKHQLGAELEWFFEVITVWKTFAACARVFFEMSAVLAGEAQAELPRFQ